MFVSYIKNWMCMFYWIQGTHAGYDAASLLYTPFNSWGKIQNLMGGKKKLPPRMDTANC